MKTLMTDWLVFVASLVLVAPSLGCDAKSTEIGATVGETEASTGGQETTGGTGASTEGPPESACGAAVDADACGAVDAGGEISCLWVDVQISDATCSPNAVSEGRCVASRYFGDGCGGSFSCVEDVSVFTRDLGDGTFEWFSSFSTCGSAFVDYDECRYDDSDPEPCPCLCQGLGGSGTELCDPLGVTCPNSFGWPQECGPIAEGDGWRCTPQETESNPVYGDDCRPGVAPEIACAGEAICRPAEGLGVAGCDGGEDGGCCTQLCDLTLGEGVSCPDEGQSCQPFYGDEPPPEGYEHVGVCRL